MNTYSLFQLSDQALTAGLGAAVARERENTALLLAHIAEFDARHLFAPAGYSCMHAYCVGALGLSEDAAFKRLQAARIARQHPAIFAMVAEGRLHLTAVVRLAPQLMCMLPEAAAELLAAAAGRSKSGLEALLAERFPRPDLAAGVRALPTASAPALVPEPVGTAVGLAAPQPADPSAPEPAPVGGASGLALVPEPVGTPAGAPAPAPALRAADRPRVALRSPERYGVQFTMGQATHELLRHVEDLLGRRLDSEDMERAFAAGLEAMVAELERRRFAATDRPRERPQHQPARGRHVPAAIKRRVWQRDQGRCTFVSESGRRCDSRRYLEYDHIEPVARGGKTTAGNLRLRCRAHNQYEAGRAFGAGFMHAVREGRRAGGAARSRHAAGP